MTARAYRTHRDVIFANGPEAEQYLHGQISQNVDDMAEGDARWSFLLEPRGNIEGFFRILRVAKDSYRLDTEYGFGQTLEESLCLLYTSPSPRDKRQSRMPSSA